MVVNLELLEKALDKCTDEGEGDTWTCPEYRSLVDAARLYLLMMKG